MVLIQQYVSVFVFAMIYKIKLKIYIFTVDQIKLFILKCSDFLELAIVKNRTEISELGFFCLFFFLIRFTIFF